MAAELGPLSLNQLQKPAQKQQQLGRGTWQWGGSRWEEDDSWEVKAFAEDTGSALGTTWPPRSYTCAFCRREFRSAQALGGHMNVHRRDRARLRQSPQRPPPSPSSITPSPPIVSSSTEFVANARLCLFYPVPPHGTIFAPYPRNELISPPTTLSFPSMAPADASPSQSNNLGLQERDGGIKDDKEDTVVEELDLELRLGR